MLLILEANLVWCLIWFRIWFRVRFDFVSRALEATKQIFKWRDGDIFHKSNV